MLFFLFLIFVFLPRIECYRDGKIVPLNTESAPTELNDPYVWLVEFYSPRCGACRDFKPEWHSLVKTNPQIRCGQVDIDSPDGMALAGDLKALDSGIPSIRLYMTKSKVSAGGDGDDVVYPRGIDVLQNEFATASDLQVSISKFLENHQHDNSGLLLKKKELPQGVFQVAEEKIRKRIQQRKDELDHVQTLQSLKAAITTGNWKAATLDAGKLSSKLSREAVSHVAKQVSSARETVISTHAKTAKAIEETAELAGKTAGVDVSYIKGSGLGWWTALVLFSLLGCVLLRLTSLLKKKEKKML
eukprot:g1255.t1